LYVLNLIPSYSKSSFLNNFLTHKMIIFLSSNCSISSLCSMDMNVFVCSQNGRFIKKIWSSEHSKSLGTTTFHFGTQWSITFEWYYWCFVFETSDCCQNCNKTRTSHHITSFCSLLFCSVLFCFVKVIE
jgi:hypothetical protein